MKHTFKWVLTHKSTTDPSDCCLRPHQPSFWDTHTHKTPHFRPGIMPFICPRDGWELSDTKHRQSKQNPGTRWRDPRWSWISSLHQNILLPLTINRHADFRTALKTVVFSFFPSCSSYYTAYWAISVLPLCSGKTERALGRHWKRERPSNADYLPPNWNADGGMPISSIPGASALVIAG